MSNQQPSSSDLPSSAVQSARAATDALQSATAMLPSSQASSQNENPKSEREAFERLRQAAEQGHAPAQSNLGFCYETGRGVAKDESKAVFWYTKAAEQGHAPAQSNLGLCYETGLGVAKNESKAAILYRKAALQGYALAQVNLGLCYETGRGVLKDSYIAFQWFTRAADQEDGDALFLLGNMYLGEYETVVPRDPVKGIALIRQAADRGSRGALEQLSFLHFSGYRVTVNGQVRVLVPQDGRQALHLALLAATPASFEMAGRIYKEGVIIPKDLQLALHYFLQIPEKSPRVLQAISDLNQKLGLD